MSFSICFLEILGAWLRQSLITKLQGPVVAASTHKVPSTRVRTHNLGFRLKKAVCVYKGPLDQGIEFREQGA